MPHGYTVERSTMKRCWEECAALSDLDKRNTAVQEFNRANQTKKRGISMTTLAFPIGFPVPFLNQGAALVMIYDDGTVSLNHGGCEMGQGLHTKMMQVVMSSSCLQAAIKVSYFTKMFPFRWQVELWEFQFQKFIRRKLPLTKYRTRQPQRRVQQQIWSVLP